MPERRGQLRLANLILAAGIVFPLTLAAASWLGARTALPTASLVAAPVRVSKSSSPSAPRKELAFAERKPTMGATPLPEITVTDARFETASDTVPESARQPFVTVRAVPFREVPSDPSSVWQTQLTNLERKLDRIAQTEQDRRIADLERTLHLYQQIQIAQQPAATVTPQFPAPTSAEEAEEPAPSPRDDVHEPQIDVQRSTTHPETFMLHIDGASLPHVLDLFGQLAGLNILASPGVQGQVTLNMQDVSIQEALAALLRSQGCVAERDGKFLYVVTAAEAATRTNHQRATITRVFQPFYMSARDFVPLLTPLLSDDGRLATTPPSDIGLARHVDDAGGDRLAQRDSLIVRDYPEVIAEVDRLIADLDVPPVQIEIGVQILSVRTRRPGQLLADFGGNVVPHDQPADMAGLQCGVITGPPATFIQSLQRVGEVGLIASPEIRVLNKQKAEIVVGERLGYKTLAHNGPHTVENVSFLESGTRLVVRPFVSPDGQIRMEIHPEQSTAVFHKETGLPRQLMAEVTTNLMVRDQCTIVIAGLVEDSSKPSSRRQILGNIPWVGSKIAPKDDGPQRTELIVLLTPRIVAE